jgi:hypothetical protein
MKAMRKSESEGSGGEVEEMDIIVACVTRICAEDVASRGVRGERDEPKADNAMGRIELAALPVLGAGKGSGSPSWLYKVTAERMNSLVAFRRTSLLPTNAWQSSQRPGQQTPQTLVPSSSKSTESRHSAPDAKERRSASSSSVRTRRERRIAPLSQ